MNVVSVADFEWYIGVQYLRVYKAIHIATMNNILPI